MLTAFSDVLEQSATGVLLLDRSGRVLFANGAARAIADAADSFVLRRDQVTALGSQDNATLHTDPGFPLVIGEDCVIGHNVVLHGCIIGSNTLIGMGAVVLNGARMSG